MECDLKLTEPVPPPQCLKSRFMIFAPRMPHLKGEEVQIKIPEWLNISELLVDRNVQEGRGGKLAITYIVGSEGTLEVKRRIT